MRYLAASLIIFFLFPKTIFASSGGNSLNCSSEYTFSINGALCSLGYIIDQFTEFTPNILSSGGYGGSLSGIAYNEYKNGTEYIALAILPLFIYLYSIYMIGESTVGRVEISPVDLIYNLIIAVILLLISVYLLSYLITFINVLDKFIVLHVISSSSPSLFETIINAMELKAFSQGIFPGIFNIILYSLLIIALFIFSFQFIVRFILLWILILLFPLAIVISVYPKFSSVLPLISSKIAQLLIIQPAFLIGISIFIVILNNFSINPVEKFILAIVCLFSLSLIPTLLNRYLNFSFTIGTRSINNFVQRRFL